MGDDRFWSAETVTLATTALSGWMVYRRSKINLLVSAVGGLHLNVLVFVGIGGACFSIFGSNMERLPYELSLYYMARVGFVFLVGYLFWIPIEIWLTRGAEQSEKKGLELSRLSSTVKLWLLVLAFIGYFGSLYEFATSGLGTIFPVLKGFLYPGVVLAISQASREDASSMSLAVISGLLASYLAIISPWRSELIMLIGCLCLAWGLKFRRELPLIGALMIVGLLVFLPFSTYKKVNYAEFQRAPFETFTQSLKMDIDERVTFTGMFFSVRVDALREMVYVENALHRGWTEYRYGDTYGETAQQLIPRVLWPDKPSFSQTAGYLLPRQIGLVGKDDTGTSWSVNFYAEFMWNFPYINLLWFVPIAFSAARLLDAGAERLSVGPVAEWFLKLNLFFLAFQVVGLVYIVTYILWTFIIVISVSFLAERRNESGSSGPRARVPLLSDYQDARLPGAKYNP